MKIKIVTLFLIILCSGLNTAYGQRSETKFLIDTTIEVMKENAVNSNKVDWPKLKAMALAESKNAVNICDLGVVFRKLLQSLNDFHGTVFCGDSTFKWSRGEPEMSDSVKNEWKKGVFLQKEILQGNIGYLRVPYMSYVERPELDKKAQALNDSLCELLNKNVKGIVLDLRLNGGGAMFPMMLGLQQLLGEGKIGSFSKKNGEAWLLHNNGFYLDSNLLVAITPKCLAIQNALPVAVLIGPATGSSGEFLAMAFKKRKNTIFIGNNTAGYVTSIQGFTINETISLYLSTGYGKDREGKAYTTALMPDISNDGPDSFNDIPNDKKVLAAMKWIRSKKLHN
jgi:carboxyl-terminal processing protease